MYTYTHVCICVCTYVYTHTHICIYSGLLQGIGAWDMETARPRSEGQASRLETQENWEHCSSLKASSLESRELEFLFSSKAQSLLQVREDPGFLPMTSEGRLLGQSPWLRGSQSSVPVRLSADWVSLSHIPEGKPALLNGHRFQRESLQHPFTHSQNRVRPTIWAFHVPDKVLHKRTVAGA